MKQQIYHKVPFGRILWDKKNKILIVEFVSTTKSSLDELDITDDQIKDFLLVYLEAFMKYRPQKVLFDYSQLFLPITDEMTQWVIENIVKKTVANGLMWLAQVYPRDVITKLGLEILVEKTISNAPGPKRMLFDDPEQAYQWLIEK